MKFEIFGRTYIADYESKIKAWIKDLEIIKEEISIPKVLSCCGLDTISFGLTCLTSDGNVCHWLFNNRGTNDFEHDITGYLLSISCEDTEWTSQRNKDLLDICYRKITFKPEIQETVISYIDGKISELETALKEMAESKANVESEKEREKQLLLDGVDWTIEEHPIRDEGGKTYEYIHTLVINGNSFTFKERNIFDVGRAITNDNGLVKLNNLEGDELRAAQIVVKYGKFAGSGIRM